MEQYGRNDLSWTDTIESEVEKTIDYYAQEWGTNELIGLL